MCDLYSVRAVVSGIRQIADGRWMWAVEYEAGHDVHWFCGETVADVEADDPDDVVVGAPQMGGVRPGLAQYRHASSTGRGSSTGRA